MRQKARPVRWRAFLINIHMNTVHGDIWTIGDHRLMCGDSTNPTDVAALMQGERAHLCFTSPPYAQQRTYGAASFDWDALMQGVFGNMPLTADGQVLVNLGLIHRESEWQPYWASWIEWMRGQGWRRFGWYVWDKQHGMAGDFRGRLAPAFEFIFHFNRMPRQPNKTIAKLPQSIQVGGGGYRKPNGIVGRRSAPAASLATHKIPDSVIRTTQHKARGIECQHPAVFPVKLAEEIIAAYSDPGQIVYEPFAGSCSQFLAAHKLDRRCMGMEINPDYCNLGIRRIIQETGLMAFNQHGVPFDDYNGLIENLTMRSELRSDIAEMTSSNAMIAS
jgi:DNA modification methylase